MLFPEPASLWIKTHTESQDNRPQRKQRGHYEMDHHINTTQHTAYACRVKNTPMLFGNIKGYFNVRAKIGLGEWREGVVAGFN